MMFPSPLEPFSDSDDDDSDDGTSDDDDEAIPDPEQASTLVPVTRKTVNTISACLSRPRVANAILLKLLTQVRWTWCRNQG